MVNAYLLPLSALLLLGGALGDHFGRRRLLVIGTGIFAVTSLVCALAPSLPVLLGARAAQGIGAALLLPNSLALLNAAFQGEKRGRAVGIWAAAGAAAAAVAPLIGGWLVGTVGWPAIFYINLPSRSARSFGAAFVEESRETGAGRTDYGGALLATAGLGGLTYALTLWSATRQFTNEALIALGIGWSRSAASCHRAPPPQPRDDPIGTVRRALLCGPQPAHLPPLRGFRGGDAAHSLRADHRRRLFAGPGGACDAATAGPDDHHFADDGQPGRTLGRASRSPSPLSWWRGDVALTVLEPKQLLGRIFPTILVLALGMTIAVAPLTSSVLGSVEEQHVAMATGFNSAVARPGGLIATALLGAVLGARAPKLSGGFTARCSLSAAVAALGAWSR